MRGTGLILLCLGLVNGLKCRSPEGASDAELKRVVRQCMHRQGQGNQDNEGYGHMRTGGHDYGQGQETNYGSRWQRSVKQIQDRDKDNRNNNAGSDQGQCVAQCFFEEMNMVDGNGLPDRRKVSYLLTKDLRDRELRNFYMDTVQQCFGYLENSRQRQNKCTQSRELIKCMSEFAKAQCDDWEEHQSMLFN